MNRLPFDIVDKMNNYGRHALPFLFIIDFEMQRPEVHLLSNIPPHIRFDIGNTAHTASEEIILDFIPESITDYKRKFDQIYKAILSGDSYLLNLTCKTPIITSASLSDIYKSAYAKYKLLYGDQFVCFSPESFVKIHSNKILSYPMKGTIDANTYNASTILTNNPKELAEHYTIVDLIRNDLSRVSKNVRVEKFRYIDRIDSSRGALLQQSTSISGVLDLDWKNHIGSIFNELLPAGSISGAPKQKTLEIIQRTEMHARGHYTGVFGVFDGINLDSGVMIRYIEKNKNQYFYRSGGGITHMSDPVEEYAEMINKIYVPIFRKHQDTASTDASFAISRS